MKLNHVRKEKDTGPYKVFVVPEGAFSLPISGTAVASAFLAKWVNDAPDFGAVTPLTATVVDAATGEVNVEGFEAVTLAALVEYEDFILEVELVDGSDRETFPDGPHPQPEAEDQTELTVDLNTKPTYHYVRIMQDLGDS